MKKKLVMGISGVAIISIAIIAAILYFYLPKEKCLDKGGTWFAKERRCVTQENIDNCIKGGGSWDREKGVCIVSFKSEQEPVKKEAQ